MSFIIVSSVDLWLTLKIKSQYDRVDFINRLNDFFFGVRNRETKKTKKNIGGVLKQAVE